MDEYESPNFNKETGRFEHLSGDKNNKSFADLFGWAVVILRGKMMKQKIMDFLLFVPRKKTSKVLPKMLFGLGMLAY